MLEIDRISHSYQQSPILGDLSLSLNAGDIGCVVGPSGCGKTTLLRCIAGFEWLTAGRIILDGVLQSSADTLVPPEKRRIGMVFQDYALLPHLTVRRNVSFGLHGKPGAAAVVADMLHRVGLSKLAERYPHELSGGQQQRVAIARALAPSPSLLLMDEPFSNIDAGMRSELGAELMSLFREVGTTVLVVTHDHQDAFALADKLGVIRHGRLLQWDSAYNVYHQPASRFVANFVGRGEWLDGRLLECGVVETGLGILRGSMASSIAPGTDVEVLLRPDDVVHDDASELQAEVISRRFRGSEFLFELRMADGSRLVSSVPSHHDHAIGEKIGIRLETDHMVVFEKTS